MFKRFFLFVLVALLSSCSLHQESARRGDGIKLSEIRGKPIDLKVIPVMINRESFVKTFEDKTKLHGLRMVPVYKRGSTRAGAVPEYRLFELDRGSPYEMLGLQAGDVLIAANDWVVFEPNKFITYVQLLQNEEKAQIEVRRSEQPILFEYTFISP